MSINEFDRLVDIVNTLRSPGGCPWDREQTSKSLLPGAVEEVYELIDAVDEEESFKIKDELGDVLLQVVMQAQIAKENGEFTIEDVCKNISDKLIRRHPHVFADVDVSDSDQVMVNWEIIKRTEKGYTDRKSVIDGVPRSFPALIRAYKLSKKASKVGFDWDTYHGALDKVDEELSELKAEIDLNDREHMFDELGDLLFAICNLARKLDIAPEMALNRASDKFYDRFVKLETSCSNAGKELTDMTLAEMDTVWDAVKKEEK